MSVFLNISTKLPNDLCTNCKPIHYGSFLNSTPANLGILYPSEFDVALQIKSNVSNCAGRPSKRLGDVSLVNGSIFERNITVHQSILSAFDRQWEMLSRFGKSVLQIRCNDVQQRDLKRDDFLHGCPPLVTGR